MAKRIGAIVSLCLIGVLVVATIILANIKVNNNISYKEPSEIWVSYNGKAQNQVESQHKDKVLKLMEEATEESFLTALFNKTLNDKAVLKQYKSTSTDIPKNSAFYVIFSYENLQKYTFEGKTLYYSELVFTVNNTDGEETTKVYISDDGTLTYSKYYELDVDYSNVFNYLTEQGYQN